MTKNIILNSLKESFKSIYKNKSLFFLLLLLQIIFFIVFSFINLTYQTKILESAKAITDYISQQQLDEVSITQNILSQKDILGGDPLSISKNFNEMAKNFRIYLAYIFLLLIFFVSLLWAATDRLIYSDSIKHSIKIFKKMLVVLLFYLGIIFLFFYSIFSISLTEAALESSRLLIKYVPFLIISMILAYFMFVSLALLHKTGLKDVVQKTLSIGIRKAHYILAVYFINIFLFVISTFLLYYFIEKSFFILILSIVMIIFSFVFGRIFMVNVVEKLEKIN